MPSGVGGPRPRLLLQPRRQGADRQVDERDRGERALLLPAADLSRNGLDHDPLDRAPPGGLSLPTRPMLRKNSCAGSPYTAALTSSSSPGPRTVSATRQPPSSLGSTMWSISSGPTFQDQL